jgi:hypothetical protein
MSSAYKMLVAGVSAIAVLISLGIYVLIIGPMEAYFVPFLKAYTPPDMWVFLGGNMIEWLFPLIWFLVTACAVLIIVRLFHQASEVSGYEEQW